MIKDIYTIDGWYSDGKVTLLRNDRKQIPISLDYVNKGFTWYYEGGIGEDPLVDPTPTNPDTPTPTDPDEPVVQPTMCLVSISKYGNGTVELSSTSVLKGSEVTVTATPYEGWQVESVTTTTGETLTGSNNVYTLTVLQDTSILVVFSTDPNYSRPDDPEPEDPEPMYYSVSIITNVSYGGTAVASPQRVLSGESSTITIAVLQGYEVSRLTVDGVDVTSNISNNKYTINNITQDITVRVDFVLSQTQPEIPAEKTLTWNIGDHGSVLFYSTDNGLYASLNLTGNRDDPRFGRSLENTTYMMFYVQPDNGYVVKNAYINGELNPKLMSTYRLTFTDILSTFIECDFELFDGNRKLYIQIENEDKCEVYALKTDGGENIRLYNNQWITTSEDYIYISINVNDQSWTPQVAFLSSGSSQSSYVSAKTGNATYKINLSDKDKVAMLKIQPYI